MSKFNEKIITIQNDLNAPKNQYNKFGKFNFRSCEDILTPLKPLLKEHGLTQTISDEILVLPEVGRTYVKAVVKVTDGQNEEVVTAFAREPDNKKGMDSAQVTGSTSSYARKYALNGMWLIDDVKDPDTNEQQGTATAKKKAKPKKKASPKKSSKKKSTKKTDDESPKKSPKKSSKKKKTSKKKAKKESAKKKTAEKTTESNAPDIDLEDPIVEQLMMCEEAPAVTQTLIELREDSDNPTEFMKKYMKVANQIINILQDGDEE